MQTVRLLRLSSLAIAGRTCGHDFHAPPPPPPLTNTPGSTTGLVIALKPLLDLFGINAVHVVTLQAISGAGYPGVPSLDILDNVIPYISGEEEKMESEYRKILADRSPATDALTPPSFPVSAACHRVQVRDGHTLAVSVRLANTATTPAAVSAALKDWTPRDARVSLLPSAPSAWIQVRQEPNRPQPRMDRDAGDGLTTVVGRVRSDPVHSVKLSVLSHNTVMGAAGSSVLNAELAVVMGLLKQK